MYYLNDLSGIKNHLSSIEKKSVTIIIQLEEFNSRGLDNTASEICEELESCTYVKNIIESGNWDSLKTSYRELVDACVKLISHYVVIESYKVSGCLEELKVKHSELPSKANSVIKASKIYLSLLEQCVL